MDKTHSNEAYWDETTAEYFAETHISLEDFHYGPLLPGDTSLGLLPPELSGLRCLEVAAGAGHNSIVLAKNGALATAVDISTAQLSAGKNLSDQEGVTIQYMQGDMDALPPELGDFDLIHTNSINFSEDPGALIRNLATRLVDNGTLIASAIHPLFHGEWLEVEDDGFGLFSLNYFDPEDDIRASNTSGAEIHSRSYPISDMFGWFKSAGLEIIGFHEPPAAAVQGEDNAPPPGVPYFSAAWMEWHDQLRRFPIMAIFKAQKRQP